MSKFKHLTWYILVDGTNADPNDVAPDDDGVLRHKSGLAVSLREDGTPMSVGVSAVENKNLEAAEAGADEPATAGEPEATIVETPPVTEPDHPAPTPEPVRQVQAVKPKRPAKSRDMKPGAGKTYETR